MQTAFTRILVTTLLFILFSPLLIQSQPIKKSAKTETATLVKSRKLVVMLRGEDASVAKKLTSADLKKYKQRLAEHNNDLQSVIKEFWKFHTSVQYMTPDKIAALNPSDYAVLAFDIINIRMDNQLTRGPMNRIMRLNICLLEKYDPIKPVYYEDVVGSIDAYDVPSVGKMDIIAAVHRVQNHLQARHEGKKQGPWGYEEAIDNAGKLQSKILLIDTAFMDKKLTEAEIKASYSYKFEISNRKAIEKAQLSRDPKYAYVYLFSNASATNGFYHCILDCATGQMLSYSVQGGFHMNNFIDPKHLEQYVLYSDYYNIKKKKKG
jgi:hypothetical protein